MSRRLLPAVVFAAMLGGVVSGAGDDKPADKSEPKTPVLQLATAEGKIKSIDVKTATVVIYRPFDPKSRDVTVSFGPDATVTVDGKEAKFADVPVGSEARVFGGTAEGSRVTDATKLHSHGPSERVIVMKVRGDAVTVTPTGFQPPPGKKMPEKSVKLAEGGKVIFQKEEIPLSDLKAGDHLIIHWAADGKAALRIAKEPPKK